MNCGVNSNYLLEGPEAKVKRAFLCTSPSIDSFESREPYKRKEYTLATYSSDDNTFGSYSLSHDEVETRTNGNNSYSSYGRSRRSKSYKAILERRDSMEDSYSEPSRREKAMRRKQKGLKGRNLDTRRSRRYGKIEEETFASEDSYSHDSSDDTRSYYSSDSSKSSGRKNRKKQYKKRIRFDDEISFSTEETDSLRSIKSRSRPEDQASKWKREKSATIQAEVKKNEKKKSLQKLKDEDNQENKKPKEDSSGKRAKKEEFFDPFNVHGNYTAPKDHKSELFSIFETTALEGTNSRNKNIDEGNTFLQFDTKQKHPNETSVKVVKGSKDFLTEYASDASNTDEDDISTMLLNEKRKDVGSKVKSKAKSTVKWLKNSMKLNKKRTNSLASRNTEEEVLKYNNPLKDTNQDIKEILEKEELHFNENLPAPQQSSKTSTDQQLELKSFSNKCKVFKKPCDEDDQSALSLYLNDEEANSLVIYENYGSPKMNMLYLPSKEIPAITQDNEVLVRVEASTVSSIDCAIRNNEWYEEIDLPNTPGCDMIGTIEQISDKTSSNYGLKLGDRVAAFSPKLGSNARFITLFASQLIPIPEDIDSTNAVCLLQAYVTAYQCLHRVGKKSLQYGDKVLVTNAQNNVGLAVAQLATLQGATIFASAREEYHELLKKYGATPIGPDQEAWIPVVQGQIDIFIYNSIYNAGGQLLPYSALSSLGKFIFLGRRDDLIVESMMSAPDQIEAKNGTKLKYQQLPRNVFCYDVFEKAKETPDLFVRDLNLLMYLLKDGTLRPAISKIVGLKKVVAAHEDFERESVWGNIVCLPWNGMLRNDSFTRTKILDSESIDNGTEVIIEDDMDTFTSESKRYTFDSGVNGRTYRTRRGKSDQSNGTMSYSETDSNSFLASRSTYSRIKHPTSTNFPCVATHPIGISDCNQSNFVANDKTHQQLFSSLLSGQDMEEREERNEYESQYVSNAINEKNISCTNDLMVQTLGEDFRLDINDEFFSSNKNSSERRLLPTFKLSQKSFRFLSKKRENSSNSYIKSNVSVSSRNTQTTDSSTAKEQIISSDDDPASPSSKTTMPVSNMQQDKYETNEIRSKPRSSITTTDNKAKNVAGTVALVGGDEKRFLFNWDDWGGEFERMMNKQ